MKKLLIILITFFSFTQNVKATICSYIDHTPTVEIHYSYGKLHYNLKHNQNEITLISKQYGITENGVFANGLASINVNWAVDLNTLSEVIGPTDICVAPSNINVFVGFENPVIYISKDLVPNSCEYNVVLRHEQTHQQINKKALEAFLPRLEAKLKKIAKEIKPIYVSNQNQIDPATKVLVHKYSNRVTTLIKQLKKQILDEQAKLDHNSNYAYEENICRKLITSQARKAQ